MSLQSISEDQKKKQIPRRKVEDIYAVRVQGRSTEGFISFKCNLRELVLPRVGSLRIRELVLSRVGAMKKGIGVSYIWCYKKDWCPSLLFIKFVMLAKVYLHN